MAAAVNPIVLDKRSKQSLEFSFKVNGVPRTDILGSTGRFVYTNKSTNVTNEMGTVTQTDYGVINVSFDRGEVNLPTGNAEDYEWNTKYNYVYSIIFGNETIMKGDLAISPMATTYSFVIPKNGSETIWFDLSEYMLDGYVSTDISTYTVVLTDDTMFQYTTEFTVDSGTAFTFTPDVDEIGSTTYTVTGYNAAAEAVTDTKEYSIVVEEKGIPTAPTTGITDLELTVGEVKEVKFSGSFFPYSPISRYVAETANLDVVINNASNLDEWTEITTTAPVTNAVITVKAIAEDGSEGDTATFTVTSESAIAPDAPTLGVQDFTMRMNNEAKLELGGTSNAAYYRLVSSDNNAVRVEQEQLEAGVYHTVFSDISIGDVVLTAYAIDGDGLSSTGETFTITVRDHSTPSNPTTGLADFSLKEGDTKYLNISGASDDDGAIEGYVVTSSNTNVIEVPNELTTVMTPIEVYAKADGTATLTVKALSTNGQQSTGVSINVTSVANVAPGKPTNNIADFSIDETTSLTRVFSGAVDGDGEVVSYKVTIPTQDYLTVVNEVVPVGGGHTFQAQSVNANQTVTISVTAIDDLGSESAAESINVTIKQVV